MASRDQIIYRLNIARKGLKDSKKELEKLHIKAFSEKGEQKGEPGISLAQVETMIKEYLVTRSCGLIEVTRDTTAQYFIEQKSHPNIARFTSSQFGKGLGVHPDQLFRFFNGFNTGWSGKLNAKLSEEANESTITKQEILAQMVGNRKKLAHGYGASVSVGTVMQYCDTAIELSEFIQDLILSDCGE